MTSPLRPRVDHVAIKTADLDRSRSLLESLGLRCRAVRCFEEVGLRIVFMAAENLTVELLEVIDPRSPLASAPPGLHHLAIATTDLARSRAEVERLAPLARPTPVQRGAEADVFFFTPDGPGGALWEAVGRLAEEPR